MRTIETGRNFRRDLKRERKGRHGAHLDALLTPVLDLLANDTPLAPHHRDHPRTGDWNDHRDCHIRPELELIYRKPDAGRLQLVRLGSHSELGI